MPVRRAEFGPTPEGVGIAAFVLEDGNGLSATVVEFGATLTSLRAPDRDGAAGEVVLGLDDLAGYLGPHPHLGGIVGRHANRIGGARFRLDGALYRLTANEGANHLHGGRRGFDRRIWRGETLDTAAGPALRLRYRSPDGEEGYPGVLDATVTYTLCGRGGLRIDLEAVTDRPTVVNLSHHGYFNLTDAGVSPVLDHELWIGAAGVTALGPGRIPTGEIAAVSGTALDFRTPRRLGDRIAELPAEAGGYDHNYVLDGYDGTLRRVARLFAPATGRVLEVETTQPGLQLYTGNHLALVGRGGARYGRHHAVCLETQHFPDSPNHPQFPSTRLAPGERYRETVVYRFSVE
jgi:aldose 1-epimerase